MTTPKHKSDCSIKTMNNTTSNPESNDEFNAGGFTYGVSFVIGIILLVLSVAFACIRLRRISNGPDVFRPVGGISPAAGGAAQSTQGLDETTLDSFPKLLFSDIQKRSSVSSSCSICCEDYKETDTLRLLPDCGHGFHLGCVDPWLRLHATCPICRSSSIQAPQSSSSRGDRVIIVG